MVETFGSGVAWIDYDNDGFQDLYFVNGAPGAPNALYHNNKDGTFTDVTAKAGRRRQRRRHAAYKTGVAVGDYDNNGYLDLYVTAFGPNILYKNNGDGTFSDVTAAAGVAGRAAEWSTSTGFFDFDRDGDLDLYVANYLDFRSTTTRTAASARDGYRMYCHPTMFDGDGRSAVSATTATARSPTSRSRPASPTRPARVSASRSATSIVTATPTSTSPTTWCGTSCIGTTATARSPTSPMPPASASTRNGKPQAGMGVDCADVDGNGFPDIFVTNFSEELNTLYMNLGDGMFEDVTTTGRAGFRLHAARLRHQALRHRQRRRPRHPRHQRSRHRQRQAVSAEPAYAQKDLLYENIGGGSSATSRARRVRRCRRTRRSRARRRRLRQRRQTRRRHLERRAARQCSRRTRSQAAATGSPSARRARRATGSASAPRCESRRRQACRSARSTTWRAIRAPTTFACTSA